MPNRVWAGPIELEPLLRPLAQLRPDPQNARRHDEESIRSIARSLTDFGQTKTIVLDPVTQIVRAGNGTLLAADSLGWTHLAAASASDLSEDEQAAYALADNRTGELSERREAQVLRQLEALDAVSPDLALSAGYTVEQRAEIALRLADEAALLARREELQSAAPLPALTMTLIFDTPAQKAIWDAALLAFVQTYPSAPTAGAALVQFLADRAQTV